MNELQGNKGYGHFEHRVALWPGSEEAIVRVHKGFKCPQCQERTEVISFGLTGPHEVHDNSETFYWCSCGHKWIEEPKTKGGDS